MPASPPNEPVVETSDKPNSQHWLPSHESKTADEIAEKLSKKASYFSLRYVLIIIILSIPLFTVGLIAYLTLGNHPYTLNESWAGGNIAIRADRQWVLFTNSCINVTWKIDHIREVYLNGKGVVGESSDTLCLNHGKPYFLVRFQGNIVSDRTYILPVEALLAKPEIWLLLILALGSTFTAAYMMPIPLFHRIKRSHMKRLSRWTAIPLISLVLILVGLEIAVLLLLQLWNPSRSHKLLI